MTVGRARLLRVLARTEVPFVAARVPVSVAAVYHWRSGRRRPNRGSRERLASLYGIPVEAWSEPR